MLNNYTDVLTAYDVAEILGIKVTDTYKLLNGGIIKSFKLKRKFFVLKIDLIHYMNACMKG